MLEGAMGIHFSVIDAKTDAVDDVAADFKQLLTDYLNVWREMCPLDHRAAGKEFDGFLADLAAQGMVISAGLKRLVLTFGGNSKDNNTMPWLFLYVAVCPQETPAQTLAVEKGVRFSL